MLVYAGIDEAGYGPMLGPLCVGTCVFGVENWSPGQPAPDLWAMLSSAVARSLSEAKADRRIAIADSKKLKLSNQTKSKHPLIHLERGVLASLAASGMFSGPAATDEELMRYLEAARPDSRWFDGEPAALPVGNDPGLIGIDAARLAGAMASSGVRLLHLSVTLIDESGFNAMLAETGSKSAIMERLLAEQLRKASGLLDPGRTMRIVADRQGARVRYGRTLGTCFGRVETLEESSRASRYAVDERHRVILHSEAEGAHLPVALASMAAKYVRELCMARFNRHWSRRMPELKPTAGYVQDARRWLKDAESMMTESERSRMVRLA